LQMPTALTYYGLANAASEEPKTKMSGVRLLRTFGDEELILRACYGLLRRDVDFDLVRTIASGNHTVPADQAREIYYRVYGQPFNSVPPPSLYTRGGRWTELDEEFSWDEGLGGEQVAGRVKGLSLMSSRMDAVAEPDAALVYCEWTMEFKNVALREREARALVALPPGGVVSRLTLWINGEEREAAFGGRSQTRQAYQEVAVVQRRDPVLVTTCGPDRVLVQCFPVPANGGVMKIRLGITAPVILESLERGRFAWPRFLERNFRIGPELKHGLWMESARELAGDSGAIISAKTATHPFTLRQSAAEASAEEPCRTVTIQRSPETGEVWSPAEDGAWIRQTIRPLPANAPPRFVIVVDGSIGMEKFIPEIAESLSAVPETAELAVIFAGDEAKSLAGNPQPATAALRTAIERSLRRERYVGGQDNLPALESGWDLAAAVQGGVVIWIHQPQPALLSPDSILRQAIERSVNGTRLVEIQTINGPDRIVEKLDGLNAVKSAPRFGSMRADLAGVLAQWTGKSPRFELVREQVKPAPDAAAPRAGKHLERLWARDESSRLAARRDREAATKMAASHQLVTPLTGAVVLETQQQFARHGLTPADPNSVPSVPEPQWGALLGVGILLCLARRQMKRTRREQKA
jgi:hypothetical protein